MNDSPDAFETPRQDEEESPTVSDAVAPARRTLVLNSTGSANSTLTGDSTTRRSTSHPTNGVLSDNDSDDENAILQFAGVSAGPMYMVWHPISIGLMVLVDIEEDENKEEGGGDSNIEGEDGKEFKQDAVEAMEEKNQVNADDSNAIAHMEKQYKVLLSRMTSGNLICLPSPPDNWVAPVPKVHKGELAFIEVKNNPGDWSQYTYHAKFDSKGQYKHHTIPTGQHKLGDWEFQYEGRESPNDCF
jgi:hypothetical protein